jgi:ATP synthase protein I
VVKPPASRAAPEQAQFKQQLAAKIARKLDARHEPGRIVWSGLGMMGLIGWSVTVPTLLGAVLGFWLDKHHPAGHSWTLSLVLGGLALGCWNAWHWVLKENKAMHPPRGTGDG